MINFIDFSQRSYVTSIIYCSNDILKCWLFYFIIDTAVWLDNKAIIRYI